MSQVSAPPSATSGGTVRINLPCHMRTSGREQHLTGTGYHLNRVRERDTYYAKLEQDRLAQKE